ncbi:MAG: SelT/SelW/SelH family protein [Polyangiaceae bacterium]
MTEKVHALLSGEPGRRVRAMTAPRIAITYCTQCRWLLRASWLAQELLSTFPSELGEVALVPGRGGVFEVALDGRIIFSRAERGRFPEPKEIKQALRDVVDPGRSLGHSDSAVAGAGEPNTDNDDACPI